MIDRFGPLPAEVENLLHVIQIKRLCRDAGVEKVEAGPKGAVLSFRHNSFANPSALVAYIGKNYGHIKLRPDHKLVYMDSWDRPESRIQGVEKLMGELVKIAALATCPDMGHEHGQSPKILGM